jgi:hypothetical protein
MEARIFVIDVGGCADYSGDRRVVLPVLNSVAAEEESGE